MIGKICGYSRSDPDVIVNNVYKSSFLSTVLFEGAIWMACILSDPEYVLLPPHFTIYAGIIAYMVFAIGLPHYILVKIVMGEEKNEWED